METKAKETEDRILIRIAEKLVEAQQELDELVVQFSLGKANAKDKFEEIKRDFAERIRAFKNSTSGQQVDGIKNELREHLEELEELLKKGAAQSVEAFKIQKDKIEDVLDRLKKNIDKQMPDVLDHEHFSHEIEKFKLKLEILRLAFALKKLEVKDSFKESMHEIREKVEHTLSEVKRTFKKSNTDRLRKEAHDVYDNLKKVIKEL